MKGIVGSFGRQITSREELRRQILNCSIHFKQWKVTQYLKPFPGYLCISPCCLI
nr:hypothetical protein [Nodosilinea sp. LEGE 07088]